MTEAMEKVLKIIDRFMIEHFEMAEKRTQARSDEYYDDTVEENLAEEDETDGILLSCVVEIMKSLFSTMNVSFLPHFNQIVSHFAKLLNPSQASWSDRQWGLCIFDYLIKFCGPACIQYQQYFLQLMIQYCKDEHAGVRQSAVYGCGIYAQHAGEQFAQTCSIMMPILVEVVTAVNAREQENIYATVNTISAISRIMKYNSSAIANKDEIIDIWFQSLPLTEEDEEEPYIYGYLCNLIQSNHSIVMGKDGCNLPRIVTIISDAFHHGVIKIIASTNDNIEEMGLEYVQQNNDVAGRMINIIKQFQSNTEQIINEQQKSALEEALKSFENITIA